MGSLRRYLLPTLTVAILYSTAPHEVMARISDKSLHTHSLGSVSSPSPIEYVTSRLAIHAKLDSAQSDIVKGDYPSATKRLRESFDLYQKIKRFRGDMDYTELLSILGEHYYSIFVNSHKSDRPAALSAEKAFYEAKREYDEVVEIFPELKQSRDSRVFYHDIWANLTNLYNSLGYFDKALDSCMNMLAFHPSDDNLEVLVYIGTKLPKKTIEDNVDRLKSIVGDRAEELLRQIEEQRNKKNKK